MSCVVVGFLASRAKVVGADVAAWTMRLYGISVFHSGRAWQARAVEGGRHLYIIGILIVTFVETHKQDLEEAALLYFIS